MRAVEQQIVAPAETNELAHYLAGLAVRERLVFPGLDLALLSAIQRKPAPCASLKFTTCALNRVGAGRQGAPQLKFCNTEECDSVVDGAFEEKPFF